MRGQIVMVDRVPEIAHNVIMINRAKQPCIVTKDTEAELPGADPEKKATGTKFIY